MGKAAFNGIDINRDTLAIIKEIEKKLNITKFKLKKNISESNEGPALVFNNQNELTGIILSGAVLFKLDKLALSLDKLPYLDSINLTLTAVADLTPLISLKGLKTLLAGYTYISDISPVAELTGLQRLEINNNPLKDLTPVSTLTSLKELQISSTEIETLSPVATLTGLEVLGAYHIGVTDLTPITSCQSLQQLGLAYCQLTDITPVSMLTQLKELYLRYNKLTDISALATLNRLQILDLAKNDITSLKPLSNCSALQNLDISYNKVSKLAPLSMLAGLKKLNCSQNPISDSTQLANLSQIEELDISHARLTHMNDQLLQHLPNLKKLDIQYNPITNIPSIISESDNCATDLRNYFKDYANANTLAYETKIILLGNGRVGKTCLVNRWLNNTFDPQEPSTHGIQLRPWVLKDLAKQEQLEDIRLNIWDFGGQDIYHATHRTFMNTEAIFLLLWDAQIETQSEQKELLPNGKAISYKNHPITYWLSYIKTLSRNSPVILVQTQRDRDGQRLHVLSDDLQKEYNVKAILSVESSKATVNGYETLKEKILEIIIDQVRRTSTAVPASWFNIRMRIAQLQEERKIKQLSLDSFQAMCNHEQLDNSSMHTLLYYFHNTGVFFYREGLFNNQIVIDQKWAIDAVYTLFDRKGHFARIHQNGRFTWNDLQEYWQQYSPEEQRLFLTFMKQCQICFESEKERFGEDVFFDDIFDEGPNLNRTFIAPQLLPENPPLAVNALRRHGNGVFYKYRHIFLHTAVIQRFIVRTAFMANENEIWQSGIVLNTSNGMALIEAFSEKNEIVIRLDDVKQKSLLDMILHEMWMINEGETGIEELVSLDGINFVNIKDLKEKPAGNKSIQAENGKWVNADKLAIFLTNAEKEMFEKPGANTIQKPGRSNSKNNRVKIPQQNKVRAELQKEVDNECPFCSNGDVGHFEIHHIDENPANNDYSNLILVCPTCHSKIDKRDISMEDVAKRKEQLNAR